jgi:hypothetical protein
MRERNGAFRQLTGCKCRGQPLVERCRANRWVETDDVLGVVLTVLLTVLGLLLGVVGISGSRAACLFATLCTSCASATCSKTSAHVCASAPTDCRTQRALTRLNSAW